MAQLRIGDLLFDAGLIVFDKDGTLIDFEFMWGRLAVAWIERLTAQVGNGALRDDLCRSLGYDWQQQRTIPQSPLAIATTGQVVAITAGILYRHGLPWPEAEEQTTAAFQWVSANYPLADLIRATGDVVGLFEQLQEGRVPIAVVTTDERRPTEEALEMLGVAHQVDFLVCGDDSVPIKPAPDAVLKACQALHVAPARTVVVGDTVVDMLMAERAAAGLRVAVLTGAGTRDTLADHADIIVDSIAEICVVSSEPVDEFTGWPCETG